MDNFLAPNRPTAARGEGGLWVLGRGLLLNPGEEVARMPLRGAAAHQLSWFDAHLWAYAEVSDLPAIIAEDFSEGRPHGSVGITNPLGS